jgi:hypothetical protein
VSNISLSHPAQAVDADPQLDRLYQELATAPTFAEGQAMFRAGRRALRRLSPHRREAARAQITDILAELPDA